MNLKIIYLVNFIIIPMPLVFEQVAACAGCNTMYPWGAALTGLVAGFAFKFWSWLLVKIKVDDPLDAVAGM